MSRKTVEVPADMAPVFARAEEAVAEYFAQFRADPAKGTIEISGERYVLVRAAALSVEFVSLLERLFGPHQAAEAHRFARNLLFDLAHTIGKSDARSFHEKMGLEDPIERLAAGPVHFSHSGWAFVNILPESRPAPNEDYYLIYDHPYSFEADSWLRSGRQPAFSACIMNAGYSSGWCEESFGLTLVASEILCRARGDECCRFVMAPPHRIEEHIQRYVRQRPQVGPRVRTYSIPGLFARKQMEDELRASEQKYRHLFENLNDAAFLADGTTGVILDVNRQGERLMGRTRDEIVGMHQTELHPPGEAAGYTQQFAAHLEHGQDADDEGEVIRKDGTIVPVTIRAAPFTLRGQRLILGIFRDITGRAQTEQELRRTLADLERFNRLAVGRELRMIELKREVNEMARRAGVAPPYDLAFAEPGTADGDIAGATQ